MQKQIDEICSKILSAVSELKDLNKSIIIAIDGNCAAGKSTIAQKLSQYLSADIVHIDNFYLPFYLRTQEQMYKPGGNIDFDRLINQVLIPVSEHREYIYKPYCCSTMDYLPETVVFPKDITIVEGAYSCHPCLEQFYDYMIFLSVDKSEQMRRIIQRNGQAKALEFKTKWIPGEEKYFSVYDIRSKCNLVLE